MTIAALQALIDEELPGIPRHPAPRIPRTHCSAKDTTMTTSPVPHPRPADPPPADAAPIAVRALIAWAHAHPDKAVRRLGDQAHFALGELRTRHQGEQELARVAAEEADLEERLAEVRARKAELAPKRKAPARDYDPATVRTWARAEGLTVPDRGKIPDAVLTAWREHHATPEAGR
ncbi:Lsr2 family DNA-binding protein [Streptomyces sp. CA-146814]|uniref:Lsr2 family DNA-binding protein n=1 Tax=Streptomyces sp. CA-146814 TaxID=3240053 RepID=UPI003D8FC8AA